MKLTFYLVIGVFLLSCKKQVDRRYAVEIGSTKFDLMAEKNSKLSDTIYVMALNDSMAYFYGIRIFVDRYSTFAELSKDQGFLIKVARSS